MADTNHQHETSLSSIQGLASRRSLKTQLDSKTTGIFSQRESLSTRESESVGMTASLINKLDSVLEIDRARDAISPFSWAALINRPSQIFPIRKWVWAESVFRSFGFICRSVFCTNFFPFYVDLLAFIGVCECSVLFAVDSSRVSKVGYCWMGKREKEKQRAMEVLVLMEKKAFRVMHEIKWKLSAEKFLQTQNDQAQYKHSLIHTDVHATWHWKSNSQAKAAKNTKKNAEKKKIIYFETAETFCFIYSPSVDEVGSVFSCAPNVEVSKRLLQSGERYNFQVNQTMKKNCQVKKNFKGNEKSSENWIEKDKEKWRSDWHRRTERLWALKIQ